MPRAHADARTKDSTAARRGRPPLGPLLAEGIDCSDRARERLRIVLATLAGLMAVEEACDALGVGPSRFHALRTRFLAEAAALLEPRAPGPAPRSEADVEARREIERLRRENQELQMVAAAARVREELAIAMPGRIGSAASSAASARHTAERKKEREREPVKERATKKKRRVRRSR